LPALGQSISPAPHSSARAASLLPDLHLCHGRAGPGLGVGQACLAVAAVVGHLMSEPLLLLAIGLTALSGVAGLFASRTPLTGQQVSTAIAVSGALVGLAGVAVYWITGISKPIAWPWLFRGSEFRIAVDGLSALFLVPILLISLLGNIYG